MALSKIQAAGLTADLIDETKLADNSIDSEHYNDGSIDNAHLADDAVGIDELSATGTAGNTTYLRGDNTWTVPPDTNTTYSVQDGQLSENNFTNADHSKLDGIAASANNYVHPNHSGEVTSTADGATVIADDVVDEANLKVDNSPTNDYVLTAKSSAAGGLTWAAAAGGGVDNVTSDAYGIIVQTTNTGNDSMVLVKGNEAKDAQIRLYADEGDDNADLWRINSSASDGTLSIQNYAGGAFENSVVCYGNGAVKLYKDNSLKAETVSGGLKVTGNISFDSNNSGLYLGGSGGSNQLNDYETGTWTPADAGGIVPFNTASGKYVKIGKSVTCWFYINVNVNVTSTGSVGLVGFPFTSANEAGASGVSSQVVNRSHDTFSGWKIDANGTVAYGWKSTLAATTRAELWDGDVTSVSMWGDITYKTAA